MSLISPPSPLRASTIEYPPPQLDDLARLLSHRDELCRHDQTTGGMPPADQCLGPDNLPRVDQHYRLVVHLELPALHRRGQLRALSGAVHHPGVKVVVVHLYATFSVFLGRIQRQIRAPKQLSEIESYFVSAAEDHPNAGRGQHLF